MNVMLGVRDITNTSATLDWIVPDDKPIVGFKVGTKSCTVVEPPIKDTIQKTSVLRTRFLTPSNTFNEILTSEKRKPPY